MKRKIISAVLGGFALLLIGCGNALSTENDWDFSSDGTVTDSAWEGSDEDQGGTQTNVSMRFEAGASVRITDQDVGIRFKAYYDQTAYGYANDGVEATEAGMIIVPAQVLNGVTGGYFEHLKTTYGKEKTDVATVFEADQFTQEADGTYSAYGAIVNINNENLAYSYQAVAYVYDGETYTYSVKSDARTISRVLNGALNDQKVTGTKRANVIRTAISVQSGNANTISEYVTETDVNDGFSLFESGDYTTPTIKQGDTELTDGLTAALACEYAAEEKSFTLTYGELGTLTVAATVWSSLIKTPADLLEMNEYTVENTTTTGTTVTGTVDGYFKLANDLDMTDVSWTADNMLASVITKNNKEYGFIGSFEGNGKTIYGFTPAIGTALIEQTGTGASVKDIIFKNATVTTGGKTAVLVSNVAAGTFEDIEIELSYVIPTRTKAPVGAFCSTFGLAGNSNTYVGAISLSNVKITNLTKSYVFNAVDDTWSSGVLCRSASALGAIGAYTNRTGSISFSNITLDGFGKNYLYQNYVGVSSQADFTTENLKVTVSGFTATYTADELPAEEVLPEIEITGTVHGGTATEVTGSYIVQNGVSDYVLVRGSTSLDNKAAILIQTYFKEATGIELNKVYASSVKNWSENTCIISVGSSVSLTTTAGVSYEYEDTSGFQIKTVGKSIFLLGSENGILNAAYELLKYLFGFEYYAENCYTIETGVTELPLCNFNISELPDIEYRSKFLTGAISNSDDTVYKESLRLYHDIPLTGGMHNSFTYVPYATYGTSNPLWYSNVADKNGKPYQLCYSYGAEFVDVAFAYIQTNFLETGATKITFQIQDNKMWCTCDSCLAAEELYGAKSGIYIKFLNMLAKKVADWCTENEKDYVAEIVGLAYHLTEDAPTVYNAETDTYEASHADVVFEPNLAMWYAPHGSDYKYSFDSEVNARDIKNLRSWVTLSDRLYMWTYNQVNFGQYFVFSDNFGSMQRNYQLMVQNGVISLRDQGQWKNQINGSAFNTLKVYLASELGWNCQVDYEQLIDNWFNACYGEAADEMRKVFDGMQDYYTERYQQGILSWYYKEWTSDDHYTEALLTEMLGYIAEAKAAIAYLNDQTNAAYNPELYTAIYDRICLEELSFRYMEIAQLVDQEAALEKANNDADALAEVRAKLTELVSPFKADCARLNVIEYADGKNVTSLWTEWESTEA